MDLEKPQYNVVYSYQRAALYSSHIEYFEIQNPTAPTAKSHFRPSLSRGVACPKLLTVIKDEETRPFG
jgi:hypothetical protein